MIDIQKILNEFAPQLDFQSNKQENSGISAVEEKSNEIKKILVTDSFSADENIASSEKLPVEDIPVYSATPTQIENWHEQLKAKLKEGLLFYDARRDFGDKLFPTFKKMIQGVELEKFKIGYDRYSGSYIFAIDSKHYLKAQTFVDYESYRLFLESDDVELKYKTPDAEKIFEKIKSLQTVPAEMSRL